MTPESAALFRSFRREFARTCGQAALLAAGGGSIVSASSVGGLVGVPGIAEYVAGKWGVIGLTESAALEVGAAGPDDIARVALFLLSDESRWTTGTVIAADGGLHVG